jgi:nitroreductase
MEFIETIKKRRSTRKFLDKPIPELLIQEMLELANLAPSAGNLQSRSVIIVKDHAVIEKIRSVSRGLGRFEGKIPVILVILAKPQESSVRYEDRGRNLYALQDATIFASYLQLIAVEKGLASCWVGSFSEEEIMKILNLPGDVRPVAMIPLGYAAEDSTPKLRKNLSEIILKEI